MLRLLMADPDFFLSRRGSVAEVAREVADVLEAENYAVFIQDYDIAVTSSFIEAMDQAIQRSRGLIILFTSDYETSPYTRKEFTSFEAERLRSQNERFIVVLRCEDAPLRGLLADNVYQDLVGVIDSGERRRRILAAINRQSPQLRPQASPRRRFGGVPPRVAKFAGREDALDRLDAILMRDRPAAVTALDRAVVHGLGGIGKTSLAVEYAHRFRALYDGVWWCSAESRPELVASLAQLGTDMGLEDPREANLERTARLALRHLALREEAWLLVYDNVTSPDEIGDLLPDGGARLLITSRFPDWRGWAEQVEIDALSPEEAVAFLQARSGRTDPDGARALADALGRLPLALDHAAALCGRTQMSFRTYAERTAELIGVPQAGLAYPQTVAATIDLAIANAVQRSPCAERMLAFLAFCAPQRIPLSLYPGSIQSETELREALAALQDVSLVKTDPFDDGVPAISIHRLVQAKARDRTRNAAAHLPPQPRRSWLPSLVAKRRKVEPQLPIEAALIELAWRLDVAFPSGGYADLSTWPTCAKLTPHVISVAKAIDEQKLTRGFLPQLYDRAASYLHRLGAFGDAEQLFRYAVAMHEQLFGVDDAGLVDRLNNLGLVLRDRGKLDEAQEILRRAVGNNDRAHWARSTTNYATTSRQTALLHNYALVLMDQGELKKSRSILDIVLDHCESFAGLEHPSTAASLNTIGLLLLREGDFSEARQRLERALMIRERALGPENAETYETINNVGLVDVKEGRFNDARVRFEQALAGCETTLGTANPTTNRVRLNFARLLLSTNEEERALQLSRTALDEFQATYGPFSLATKQAAEVASAALGALNRADEAGALQKRFHL